MDQKRIMAFHETGHAVMALICRHRIQKLSLRGMDSPRGTHNYHAFMTLEPVDPAMKFTGERAIQKIMISLGGFASEAIFLGGTIISGDDLTVATEIVESMMKDEQFRDWTATLPVPASSALDSIENPSIRAYIDQKMRDTVKALAPLREVIQIIAEELYKKDELTGDEVAAYFNAFIQSMRSR